MSESKTTRPNGESWINDILTRNLYLEHCSSNNGVVLVNAINGDNHINGIFSCLEKAQQWTDGLGDEWACIFSPFIIDEPDYGNAVKQ